MWKLFRFDKIYFENLLIDVTFYSWHFQKQAITMIQMYKPPPLQKKRKKM